MKAHRVCRILLIVLAAPAVGGCSADPMPQRPKLVPVHGVVRFNGKPLEAARVTFSHTTAGVSAYGDTDAEGKFTLTTFQPGDGATPGKYQVAVVKAQVTGHPTAPNMPPVFRPGAAPHPRWLIPQKYANLATSGLTAEVNEAGDNEVVLDLKGAP
jgi:hypothetical protein